jgi:hypothetical protein
MPWNTAGQALVTGLLSTGYKTVRARNTQWRVYLTKRSAQRSKKREAAPHGFVPDILLG